MSSRPMVGFGWGVYHIFSFFSMGRGLLIVYPWLQERAFVACIGSYSVYHFYTIYLGTTWHNYCHLFGKLTSLATPIWRSTKFYMLKWELFHHQPWFWPWFGAVALQAPCWILKSVKSGCVCQEPCNVCTIQTQVGKIASSYDIKCSIYCLYLQKIVYACAWFIRKY